MAIHFWPKQVGEDIDAGKPYAQVQGVQDKALRHSKHRAKMLLSASELIQTKHILTTKNSSSLSWSNWIE
jgi:hypothetical protein